MAKLGVIGGLGSKATAYFFNQLVDMTEANNDQEHIELMIHNHPQIPDRTAYILGKSHESPMPMLLQDTMQLLAADCDAIYVPCNTAHYFINQFDPEIKKYFIHMIDETVQAVQRQSHEKVLLLATSGTVETKLYQTAFAEVGITCEVPDDFLQAQVMSIIYDKIKAGQKVGIDELKPFLDFAQQKEAGAIILGCTELSLLKSDLQLSDYYIDAMECAIKACIIKMNKAVKSQ